MSTPIREIVDWARTLDGVLGLEHVEMGEGSARGRFAVEDRVRQRYGLVHGGAYAALAEGLVSEATLRSVGGDGRIAVGQSNSTSFLRPVVDGVVQAEARARHRGRTTWVWDVDFTTPDGRLCATSRVTIAVRELPPGARSGQPPDAAG